MITTLVLRNRVRTGMHWLKTEGPRYSADIHRVDWSILDLRKNRRCVLGQAVAVPVDAYTDGYSEVFLQRSSEFFLQYGHNGSGGAIGCDRRAEVWMQQNGFDFQFNVEEHASTWQRLRDAWIEAAIAEGLYQPIGAH